MYAKLRVFENYSAIQLEEVVSTFIQNNVGSIIKIYFKQEQRERLFVDHDVNTADTTKLQEVHTCYLVYRPIE